MDRKDKKSASSNSEDSFSGGKDERSLNKELLMKKVDDFIFRASLLLQRDAEKPIKNHKGKFITILVAVFNCYISPYCLQNHFRRIR